MDRMTVANVSLIGFRLSWCFRVARLVAVESLLLSLCERLLFAASNLS